MSQYMFDNNPEIFNGKIVLVTGGTGSFGTRFAQYVLDNSTPKKLIIFSRDEFKQFEMENNLMLCSQEDNLHR